MGEKGAGMAYEGLRDIMDVDSRGRAYVPGTRSDGGKFPRYLSKQQQEQVEAHGEALIENNLRDMYDEASTQNKIYDVYDKAVQMNAEYDDNKSHETKALLELIASLIEAQHAAEARKAARRAKWSNRLEQFKSGVSKGAEVARNTAERGGRWARIAGKIGKGALNGAMIGAREAYRVAK